MGPSVVMGTTARSQPPWARVAMRSPLPFPCVPDRPYKILLVQVGTLSFSHPSFGVPAFFLLFIYLLPRTTLGTGLARTGCLSLGPSDFEKSLFSAFTRGIATVSCGRPVWFLHLCKIGRLLPQSL